MQTFIHPLSSPWRLLRWLFALALAFTATLALADPPGRVGTLSHIDGSVALAPAGETEWADATLNRPITQGDRLWTDPGARAELHAGSAALHLGGRSLVEVVALDARVLQLSLREGSVNARVRLLEAGENFEIDTPQLAFRATQPGDYRIDVDPNSGTTRVSVRSGGAMVYGGNGAGLQLFAGQQMAFLGRDLAPVASASPAYDAFDQWAAERNRLEDQSASARFVPREVVGYPLLDAHGVWSHDPGYGAVWVPRVTLADWAPYRYGRWQWIAPWGWTWIDDAPWGFAPFHYGRWAQIGSRWAWVPGPIGPRPIYAPALVVFVGGNHWNLSISAGPGVAWFPLAPGEAWRPAFRASDIYVRNVNRHVVVNNTRSDFFQHQRRPEAITAVRVEDFNRGRPVHQHWQRINPTELARLPIPPQPELPPPRRVPEAERTVSPRAQPRPERPSPAAIAHPQPLLQAPRAREDERATRIAPRAQEERRQRDEQVQPQRGQREQQIEQQRAQHEQALRQQQAAEERLQRRQDQQQRVMPQQVAPAPQTVQPPAAVGAPGAAAPRGEGRKQRAEERRAQPRDERPPQGGDEDGRGRGRAQQRGVN